jgi:hypothetical protein
LGVVVPIPVWAKAACETNNKKNNNTFFIYRIYISTRAERLIPALLEQQDN